MFDFTEKTLARVTLFIDKPITLTRCNTVVARRDNRFHALYLDSLDKRIALIALVVKQSTRNRRSQLQQRLRLPDVACLALGQNKIQRIAKGFGNGVNLGRITSFRASQRFNFRIASRGSRHTGVGASNRAVDQDVL